jgi:hypothetical protein
MSYEPSAFVFRATRKNKGEDLATIVDALGSIALD